MTTTDRDAPIVLRTFADAWATYPVLLGEGS